MLIYISKMATSGRLHFSYNLHSRYISQIACMFIAEIQNDTLNQAELNQINIKNHEIFEVPARNENLRRQTLILHLKSLLKNV